MLEAIEDVLKQSYFLNTQYTDEVNETNSQLESKQIDFILSKMERSDDGRLIIPLLWKTNLSHLLSSNFNLSKSTLFSNLNKYKNDPEKLALYDAVFREQEEAGIIERIHDIDAYIRENPTCSFLAHMPVFRLDRESTKCRVVYLSNLAEKGDKNTHKISHNQAMYSGPNLNCKITTALTKLRFDEFILCFDLQKAFLNISLFPVDQNKLLFLWFQNPLKNNYNLIFLKSLRLPFGLVCSPFILMIGLYKILIEDSDTDAEDLKQLKKLIFDLIYVDNGCITATTKIELKTKFRLLKEIFAPYKFSLQQIFSNDEDLVKSLDSTEVKTENVKLLGLKYNPNDDTLSVNKLCLDCNAKTKRSILSSLASNFDLFQFDGPLLNRARLFVHKLQCDSTLQWDTNLSTSLQNEWTNIALQVNSSVPVKVKRFVGNRDSRYRLVAFTDASKAMVGTVLYIQEICSNRTSFLMAKNKIVSKTLENKTIPVLELFAVSVGVETLMDIYNELSCESSVVLIQIDELHLYSDSMVSLNWINRDVNKLEKTQKYTIFVKNRLQNIIQLCAKKSVKMHHIAGFENPADATTRCISHKLLQKTNYHLGPEFLSKGPPVDTCLSFEVPNPYVNSVNVNISSVNSTVKNNVNIRSVVPLERFSSLNKVVRVLRHVKSFIVKLKSKVAALAVKTNEPNENSNLTKWSYNTIIESIQRENFSEIFEYFENSKRKLYVPNIVTQLNVFLDNGILRVRSKFRKWTENATCDFPILLPKTGPLTEMLIRDVHHNLSHAGIFTVLTELRKSYHIPKPFSSVK